MRSFITQEIVKNDFWSHSNSFLFVQRIHGWVGRLWTYGGYFFCGLWYILLVKHFWHWLDSLRWNIGLEDEMLWSNDTLSDVLSYHSISVVTRQGIHFPLLFSRNIKDEPIVFPTPSIILSLIQNLPKDLNQDKQHKPRNKIRRKGWNSESKDLLIHSFTTLYYQ